MVYKHLYGVYIKNKKEKEKNFMKKIMGRVLPAILVATMTMSMLSGCGSTTKNVNTNGSDESFSGTCVVYLMGSRHNEAVYQALDALKALDKYADVTFQINDDADETLNEKVPTYVAAGQQIDIVYNNNPLFQQSYVDGGVLLPLDEYVEKYKIDMEKQYGKYAKYAYNNGQVYGIPGAATVWGLYYNKQIFDNAGVDYPDDKIPMTWDEYSELSKKLTSGSGPDKIYGALHLTWPMYWYGQAIMALGGGEKFYKEDGTSNIQDPIFATALERTYNMMNVDKSIRTNADIATTGVEGTAFLDGHYGMMFSGTWVLNWLADKESYPRDFEVGIAPLPVDAGTTQKEWGVCGTFSLTQTAVDPELSFNVMVDLVRETTKRTSTEIYADQTVSSDLLFKETVEKISEFDKQITVDQVRSIFLNPDMIFVTEKVAGKNPSDYQTVITEETDLYFAKEQDLKTTIDNIEKRGNKVIE